MALSFETGMQNLVYQMDAGVGRKVIQTVLIALFAIALAALYTFSNFQGLKDARAMEEAQLARNLAERGSLVTQCVRPLSMWRVAERSADGSARVAGHPDLFHPPLWPGILATVYRMTGAPRTGVPSAEAVYEGDYVPVAMNHLFVILAGLWVWLIGRKLFAHRVGALSTGAFLLSDLVWRQAVAGADLGVAMFFVLGAVYAALWVADTVPGAGPMQDAMPVWRWLAPLVLSSLMTAAAFMTRYAAGSVALLVFLFIGVSRRRRPWSKACLFILLALLPTVPWMMRNWALSGNPFGLVFHGMLADTYLFPGDALARSIDPEIPDAGAVIYAVQIKMMANLRTFLGEGLGMGEGGGQHPDGALWSDVSPPVREAVQPDVALVHAAGGGGAGAVCLGLRGGKPADAGDLLAVGDPVCLGLLPGAFGSLAVRSPFFCGRGHFGGDVSDGVSPADERVAAEDGTALSPLFSPLHRVDIQPAGAGRVHGDRHSVGHGMVWGPDIDPVAENHRWVLRNR